MSKKDPWDLTDRPHTKLKLEIYKKYLDSWCAIFKNQSWAKEIFIIDCFAGQGYYKDNGKVIDGSPLIAVKTVKKFQELFNLNKNKGCFKIKCIFIEENKKCVKNLKNILSPYSDCVDYEIIPSDFNKVICDIVKEINYKPTLFFIDPYGIKPVKKESIFSIVNKNGAKDILFNYMNEGVIRIAGLTRKCMEKKAKDITSKEIKTITNLTDFLGEECLDIIDENEIEILKYYL